MTFPSWSVCGSSTHQIIPTPLGPISNKELEITQSIHVVCNQRLTHIQRRQPFRISHQPILCPLPSQPQIGIVRPQTNSVFCPRSEHSVRLRSSLSHQIVDENADISFVPAQNERYRGLLSSVSRTRCTTSIGAGNDALCTSLFVTGGAADLSSEVEACNRFCLQCVGQNLGIDEIVLHVISWSNDFSFFQTLHTTEDLQLNFFWIRTGHAIWIHNVSIQPFWFQERIMALSLRKPLHFFVNTRAIPRPVPLSIHPIILREQVRILHH
mmetsp:Transcript_9803/g.17688  ORF Transcript_9803/g.17688 Transcript_9803/m.17688 type:complete len:268 (-) Transcript_9803:65-868(-)